MTRLEATAYHEAGHAVLALWHERSFSKVTIVEEGDNLGAVFRHRTSLKIDRLRYTQPNAARLRTWAEINTQILLAGREAERRFTGRRNNVGASSDLNKALRIASILNDGDTAASKWLDWQMAVTEGIVGGGAWELIERGAASLMEHRTLTGRDFHELVYPPLSATEPARSP